MSLADHEIRLLCEQFSALHDGLLPPDDVMALERMILEDAVVRAIYIRYAHLCAGLEWDYSEPFEALPSAFHGANMSRPGEPAASRGIAMLGSSILNPESPPVSLDSPTEENSASAFGAASSLSWLFGWRGVVLTAVALAATSAAFLVGRNGAIAPERPEAFAANLSNSEVFDPRTIRLDSGSAKITLPKVGYMLVDGPADVELISPLRAKLNGGRIRVRVTESSGHGFVVETPDGDVADLSTEFGLDVSKGKKTGVVVFDGQVDLHPGRTAAPNVEGTQRLIGGEGVLFNRSGELDRIVSIVTGRVATFQPEDDTPTNARAPVIKRVRDSLPSSETKRFYEIVPGGLVEDSLAYADRPEHEWNGLTEEGIPSYLIGADYVKTFCDDKIRTDFETRVTISCPAKLYVFYDEELKPPKWLQRGFRKTNDKIGRDLGKWPTIGRPVERAVGAGNSVDHTFEVWERVLNKPCTVKLGANGRWKLNGKPSPYPHMYGFAAVALDSPAPDESPKEAAAATSADGAKSK